MKGNGIEFRCLSFLPSILFMCLHQHILTVSFSPIAVTESSATEAKKSGSANFILYIIMLDVYSFSFDTCLKLPLLYFMLF